MAIVLGASSNTLDHNVISGNANDGVFLDGDPTGFNTLTGNIIGLDGSGSYALSNGFNGVELTDGASWNTIGGSGSGQGNLISGNTAAGVRIDSGSGTAVRNVVAGNYIGTDANGTAAIPNSTGLVISNSSLNTIGGTVAEDPAAAGNLISGNATAGVDITGSGSISNEVSANLIGTDASGDEGLGNGVYGVVLEQGASGNTIGGLQGDSTLNVISDNGFQGAGGTQGHGVYISGRGTPAKGNVVEGNYIGVGVDGSTLLGNAGDGVFIEFKADSNTIGGTVAAAGNVISDNGQSEVLGNGTSGVEIDSSSNVVAANYIGVASDGSTKVGNAGDGVLVGNGAANNTIGGTVTTAGNVISGNGANGVEINGSSNVVAANYIGVAEDGITGVGNANDGVLVNTSATNNTIGGTVAAAGNVIAANGTGARGGYGLDISGNGTFYDYDYIGVDVDGGLLSNKSGGVYVFVGSTGTVAGTHNQIQP